MEPDREPASAMGMNPFDVADAVSLTAGLGTFNRGEIMSHRQWPQAISFAT